MFSGKSAELHVIPPHPAQSSDFFFNRVETETLGCEFVNYRKCAFAHGKAFPPNIKGCLRVSPVSLSYIIQQYLVSGRALLQKLLIAFCL